MAAPRPSSLRRKFPPVDEYVEESTVSMAAPRPSSLRWLEKLEKAQQRTGFNGRSAALISAAKCPWMG